LKTFWIWYPGDFEIHQGMLQNFSREERGMNWPAYWYIDDSYKNIKFIRTYTLDSATSFTVHSRQQGFITINDIKYKINQEIKLAAGEYEIIVYVFSSNELPSVYIQGEKIYSDNKWTADNYITKRLVGYNELFTKLEDDPAKIPYEYKEIKPVKKIRKNDGLLIDFDEEVNAKLQVNNLKTPITICYGESETEALDTINCYYQQSNITADSSIPKRAFRYLFIPNFVDETIDITAISVFLPMKNVSKFISDDKKLNTIWDNSIRTFKLCSDLFYLDGIKRDRWIWGGDAYQDNFINQYSFFNEDIDKRTIWALRGHDAINQHINTIVDYSLLWVISIYNHYEMTADVEFIKMIMPRMESMMQYLLKQTNELGFIYGRKEDWIFVDWSEMDKEGTVAAEQMLLLQALKAMITTKNVIGESIGAYQNDFNQLKENTLKYFWDEKQGAFIDSYESGKSNVTRHANILAVLFDLVDDNKKQNILTNVLLNEKITKLTTPYFKFFEQDALCKLGKFDQVFKTIKEYWGSMIDKGATTIWEEYDPDIDGDGQYSMYGDPFGKSLCHAWGASPVYLLGRYFIGLKPTKPGYETFEITPYLNMFEKLEGILPIKNGMVKFKVQDNQISIFSNRDGGIVNFKNQSLILEKDKWLILK
jgi:alpha-L-rhamnosidase